MMKALLLFFLYFVFYIFNLYSQEKPIIGILDIVAKEGVSKSEARILTDFIYDSVFRFGKEEYKLIARDRRDEILREQEFSISNLCEDTSCAVEIGKMLSAEFLITGSFTKFGTKYYLIIQIVEISSTQIIASNRVGEANLDNIADSIDIGIKKLFEEVIIKEDHVKSKEQINETAEWIEIEEIPDILQSDFVIPGNPNLMTSWKSEDILLGVNHLRKFVITTSKNLKDDGSGVINFFGFWHFLKINNLDKINNPNNYPTFLGSWNTICYYEADILKIFKYSDNIYKFYLKVNFNVTGSFEIKENKLGYAILFMKIINNKEIFISVFGPLSENKDHKLPIEWKYLFTLRF